MSEPTIVTIEKLVFGGQGLARVNGKVIFVWNALPGETVEIEILKEKKGITEAVATKILTPSPHRVDPKDAHFLSTSPWQICDYTQENIWKKEVALETYRKIGGDVFSQIDLDIIFPDEQYHYRNKMEFSFTILPDGSNSLAFFKRGKRDKFPIEKSELAEPIINETANKILTWINENHIPIRSLKSLIIRSDGRGHAISALFIKDKLQFETYPETNTNLLGFQLYYSTHKSPASVPTQLVYTTGQDYITIELKTTETSTKLKSGLLSFFQVHIPIFEKALHDIATHIGSGHDVIDFYSGVGSIGLPLANSQTQLTLVDNNEEAIEYAKQNIIENNLNNSEAHCILAEKMIDIVTKDKIIIVDPPRAGLHPNVVTKLLEVTPPKIIYLSCDLSTQARDIGLLSLKYSITFSQLYNFFPRTPHIEGLVVLEKK
ncbi:MAG: class I SAM-dependent RNA methyltransferase [Candidatus Magasanikbacteria bacterium]|nr:class I SAM-dependent RNA methyltransferase [Candidatus Magasanikbacteria bacterium]